MTNSDITMMTAADGMSLACRYLPGEGNLIVALHGFTGDSTTMAPLVERCRGGRPAVLVDIIGHGQSSAPDHQEHYSMASVVDQVLSLLPNHDPLTVHLLGYSMGGRIALSMAARAPWYFASVSLLSATAGIADLGERSQRYEDDQRTAQVIDERGVDAFVDDWLKLPLFAPYIAKLDAAAIDQTRSQRSAATAVGLANSLRGTGTGSMPPLWHLLPSIRSPLLAIAGALDVKYVAVAKELGGSAAFGQSVIIPDVGHVVHHENLDAVSAAVSLFLTKCESDAD